MAVLALSGPPNPGVASQAAAPRPLSPSTAWRTPSRYTGGPMGSVMVSKFPLDYPEFRQIAVASFP